MTPQRQMPVALNRVAGPQNRLSLSRALESLPPLLLLIVCFALFPVGCGLTVQQRAAIQRFSAATIDFATLTSSELIKSRNDVVDMNKLRIRLKDDTVKPGRLDEHFTVERVKVRLDAVTALKEYAELLHALATSSQKDQLENAANSFVTSLRKVRGVSLNDEKAGVISLAVQQVGGLLIEYMRAKAAQEVVTATHPSILQLLELVQQDFSPAAEHWSLGYDKAITALRGAAALAARGPDGATRASLVGEAEVIAEQNRARFSSVAAQVTAAVAALREAQINLRSALQSPEVTIEDINTYVARIQDFVKVYRILRGE